jgi:hypothetical protein
VFLEPIIENKESNYTKEIKVKETNLETARDNN